VLWSAWQWRAGRLRALASTWAHDPPPRGDGDDHGDEDGGAPGSVP
jgi:hypothetical protein